MAPLEPERAPDLAVLAHNIHAGAAPRGDQKARRFLNLFDDVGATVGVVTEAKTAVAELEASGLVVLAEDPLPRRDGHPLPEQGDTVVVVDGLKVPRSWAAVQRIRFLVRSHHRWHLPRRDRIAMLRGPVRGVWGIHLPPGGPGSVNGDAWREQLDRALRWAVRGGCRIIVGDFNADAPTIAAYLERAGIQAEVIGRGVDLVIVVNGTAQAKPLGHQGSDHPAVLYGVTANPTALQRARRALRRWLRRVTSK